jgi:flagellar hook protein FlgE
MLRSLYSGISGLRAHQTMLDVAGNNIANVNTTAYKGSATQFQDTLSQLSQAAGGPQTTVGGTNPAQVGLGVRVAGISTNFAQGSAQTTGRGTDVMISGDGFFVTQMGGQTIYTRDGSFSPDASGRLVTANGAIVQGWPAVNGQVVQGGTLGDITLPNQAVTPAVATTAASMSGNLPSDAASGTVIVRDINVYDAAGIARKLSLTFTSTGPGAWNVSGDDGSGAVAGTMTASGGTSTFTTSGSMTAAGAFTVGGVTVDLSKLTGFAGMSTSTIDSQNGLQAGTLESWTMAKDGTIVGSFSNGASEALGKIVLATFVNPGGLQKSGASGYQTTFNSGPAQIGSAGSPGMGTLDAGSLEMSNVDLSQEFTNLIVAQRGFQANARIITTSDQVLQELVDLKR